MIRARASSVLVICRAISTAALHSAICGVRATRRLEIESAVYFGGGLGVELRFNQHLGLRAEAIVHDTDAVSATVSLVTRFGGRDRPPADRADPGSRDADEAPPDTGEVVDLSVLADEPGAVDGGGQSDTDGDGVANRDDVCLNSAANFPVKANGCALLDGVLPGVGFVDRTARLDNQAFVQLDFLAETLRQYPQVRIELHAHTDDSGDRRADAVLTRGRLRTISTYLVERGIAARRLILRPFGSARTVASSAAAVGRQANNRIEVVEHLP